MHTVTRLAAAALIAAFAVPLSAAALEYRPVPASAPPLQVSGLVVTEVEPVTGQPGVSYAVTAHKMEPLCPDTGSGFRCLGMREVRYVVYVSSRTQLLDRDRRPLQDDIAVGDTINVYGRTADERMDAEILRDLDVHADDGIRIVVTSGWAQLKAGLRYSVKLAVSGGTAPYRWQARNLPPGMTLAAPGPIYCVTAPCPQPPADTARVKGAPTQAGTYETVLTVVDARGSMQQLVIPFTVREQR